MKKTRLLAGALALLLLAGCGPTAEDPKPTAKADDLALQAVGVRKDQPLATVDGVSVETGEYLFWLANAIAMRQYYGGLTTDAGWAEMTEELKADALDTAILYQVIRAKVKEYGVELTAEQTQQMEEDLATAIENLGGEEAFLNELDLMCVDQEGYEELNRVSYLYRALQDKLVEEGALEVTQEDVDEFVTQYIETNSCYAAKHILISTRRMLEDGSYEEYSDEEKAQAYQLALNLRDQLAQAGDSEELFDELMNEFSQDGRDGDGNLYSPNGYTLVHAGEMVPEFEAGALSLEVGRVGDIVRTDYGYHIIMRIPLDTTELEEYAAMAVTEQYKMGMLAQEWVAQAEVVTEAVYDSIDPKTFYDKLAQLAQARAIARQLEISGEPTASPAQ